MAGFCNCFLCCFKFACGNVCNWSCGCGPADLACGTGLCHVKLCCLEQGYKTEKSSHAPQPIAESVCFCNWALCGCDCGRYGPPAVATGDAASGSGSKSVEVSSPSPTATVLQPPPSVSMDLTIEETVTPDATVDV